MRNRFTIDTDIVFDGEAEQNLASPQELDTNQLQQDNKAEQHQHSELAGDTDRWVEEQFDLEEYENHDEGVKETDILSDDDEFSHTPRAASDEAELEAPVMALSLEGEETEESCSPRSPMACDTRLTDAEKQSSTIDSDVEDQQQSEKDEIWVRRERSSSTPDCGT